MSSAPQNPPTNPQPATEHSPEGPPIEPAGPSTDPQDAANRCGVWWVKLLVLVLLLRLLVAGAYKGAISEGSMHGIDHAQYHQAAVRLAGGRELYVARPDKMYEEPFPYSPYLAFVFRPLVRFGQARSYQIWLCVNIGCLVAGALLMARALRNGRGTWWPLSLLFLITGFRYWPSVCEFSLGNVHFELLLLTCLMFWAARNQKWAAVALLIAVAAMMKTWMIGFAVAPLFAARYRDSVLAAAGAIALWLGAFAVVGMQQLPKFISAMRMYSVQPNLVTLSAPGVARQFFSVTEHMQPLVVSPILRWLVVAAAVVVVGLLGAAVFSRRRMISTSDHGGLLIAWCASLALMLLTLCHLEYFIILLPGLWAMLAAPLYLPRRLGWLCCLTGLAAYLLLASPTPTSTPIPPWAQSGLPRLLTALPLLAATLTALVLTRVLCARPPVVKTGAEKPSER